MFIPADSDTYIDLHIKLFVRGKLVSGSGTDVDFSDHAAVVNNFIHSLFSQYNVTVNGVTVTQVGEHYNYRSYFETLLIYGNDAAASHLTNAYWYIDTGDTQLSASKDIQLYGRLHSDLFNVPLYLLPGVRLQIKLTKARPSFYMMDKNAESKTTLKFLDAQLLVRRVSTYTT